MMRRASLVALALVASGCFFRLTDPIWAFKSLSAPEPDAPGSSLVFGSFTVEGGLFGIGAIDTVVFRRVRPGPAEEFRGVTAEPLFRVFQPRLMKNGYFVLDLPPGVYELVQLVGSSWGQGQLIRVGEDARVGSRFTITRPGIYDLGILKITSASSFGMMYELEHLPPGDDHERAALLRDAVEDTQWQRFLPKEG